MTANDPNTQSQARAAEASDWFARMRGPDAGASRSAFDRWRSDPANAGLYAQMEAVWAAAGRSQQLSARAQAPRRSWLRPAMAAAAVLVLAVVLGMGAISLVRAPQTREALTYASPASTIRRIELPDGTIVTLDRGSRMATAYSGQERQVRLLAGRGRFDVAQDPARPFVVLAGSRAVIARGTVFDVNLRGEALAVSLIEGSVDLEQRNGAVGARRLARLDPGQTASFTRSADMPLIAEQAAGAWLPAMLAGDGLLLEEIIAEVNRRGSLKIRLAEPAIGSLRVSGGFNLDDPRALAEALADALGLRAVRRGGAVIVLERPVDTPPAELSP